MNARGHARVIIMLAAIMITSMVYIFKAQDFRHLTTYSQFDYDPRIHYTDLDGYLVNNPQCKIPDIEPWDKSVRAYFTSSKLLHCSKRPLLSSIVTLKNGTYLLRIEKSAIDLYKERSTDALKCCYSEITRISETLNSYDIEADNKFRYSTCKSFENEELLPKTTEFIRVKCMLNRKRKSPKEVYRDAHAVVPILPSALRKMQAFDHLPQRNMVKGEPFRRLNLMILGIDSVSRLNLRRMMPNTFEYLRKNEWIELSGYTKIADNTFPNLMAILSGRDMRDINSRCHYNRSKSLDDCPYVWKKFSDAGYVTAYAEDTPNISTFNYLQTGFVEKPTDYYLRPFMLAVHSSLVKKKVFGLPACVGPVAPVDHILNYARRFLTTFNDFNHFSLFWMNSLSHNNPSTAQNMDHRILTFFHDLFAIGTYDNTVIFFLSDHGTRFGDFRHTFIGYYEERLPFMFMWFPEWFKKTYPHIYRNILINQKRLTCPFDVHLTLMKILKGDYTNEEGFHQNYKLPACPQCKSVFDRIPWSRSCDDAAIEPVWCMCNDFKKISISEPIVPRLGLFVRNVVLNETKKIIKEESLNGSICAIWSFNKVIRVHEIISIRKSEFEVDEGEPEETQHWRHKKRKFVILVEMNPGKTRFEALVQVTQTHDFGEEYFQVKSFPSRLDGYSKFSECVKSPHLKYYCYCSNL